MRRSTPFSSRNSSARRLEDDLIEILAAEVGVAAGRLDAEDAAGDVEDRDVERAAAEVVDGDGLGLGLVEAVGERGRGGLVDDAAHLEPGDAAGVLGGLPLGVVEVGGHRDHRLGHGLAEVLLGDLLHLLEDDGARSPAASSCAPRTSTQASPLGASTIL